MRSPAFQFYPDDWLGSSQVNSMNLAEQGAYIRLLCIAWGSSTCSLPDNDKALARMSWLGKDWHSGSGEVLRECFYSKGGRLFNTRLLAERDKQDKYHAAQRARALLRWEREKGKGKREEGKGKRGKHTLGIPPGNATAQARDNKPAKSSNSKHLFHNSRFYDFELFKQEFPQWAESITKKVYETMRDWADSKGVMRVGWIAQARNIYRNNPNQFGSGPTFKGGSKPW